MSLSIRGIGTATPPQQIAQADAAMLAASFIDGPAPARTLAAIYRQTNSRPWVGAARGSRLPGLRPVVFFAGQHGGSERPDDGRVRMATLCPRGWAAWRFTAAGHWPMPRCRRPTSPTW